MLEKTDQVQSFWIASRALRVSEIPGDVADNLAKRQELTAERVRLHCVETLCILGSETTIPRLRRRIVREWAFISSFAPQEPLDPQPRGAA